MQLEIVYLPVGSLKPYEKNTRKHGAADVEKIAESIRRYGFSDPVGVWGDENLIVEGHGRVMAAQSLGLDSVPCVRLDHLSETERREYAIAHNRTAELSAWDDHMLTLELPGLDLAAFGFPIDPKNDFRASEDVFDIKAEVPPIAEYGSMWKLGGGRLLVGDSTKLTDVRRLVGSARIDMLLTDPPYGVDYRGAAGRIANDSLSDDDFTAFLANAFCNAASVMRPGASFYIWFSFSRVSPFLTAMRESGLVFHQVLVWLKNQFTLGRSDYQNKFEPCFGGDAEPDISPQFYGWKEGSAHTFRYDRKQSTVLQFDKPSKSSLHPTMKPVPLFDYLMKAGTSIGDNVLDLFAGSGTTLIAGEQNGRNVYCMEYDPHYADVIISRWEKLTGKKAERIIDGMEDGNGG